MGMSLSSMVIRTLILCFALTFHAAGVCYGLEPAMESAGKRFAGSPSNESSVKKRFETLYGEWQDYWHQPPVVFSSRSDEIIDCRAYRDIAKLGEEVLPYLIEKMESGWRKDWSEGEFFLWYAVREISGVDLPRDSLFYSEQDMAAKYISWWKEQQRKRQEGKDK